MKIEITYRTNDTINDFIGIDHDIERVVGQHGGIIDAAGMGPEGREVVVDVFPNTELKRILRGLSNYQTSNNKLKYFVVKGLG